MVTNQSNRYLDRDSFTLRRCGCAECMGSQVICSPDFNQTHNALMFSSKCKTFALQVGYVSPSLAAHYFRVNTG